jgi:hypothetical protein
MSLFGSALTLVMTEMVRFGKRFRNRRDGRLRLPTGKGFLSVR